jgi:hypothetical protein
MSFINRFLLDILTIVTGGSHNSSGLMFSNVISFASGSPGEQVTQSKPGPFGDRFFIYKKRIKNYNEYTLRL